MENVTVILFVAQFFIYFAVLIYKLYCVMSNAIDVTYTKGEKKENKLSSMKRAIITLIIGILAYGVGFVTTLSSVRADVIDITYISLFKLETWSLVFMLALFIVELFYFIGRTTDHVKAAGTD